MKRGLLLILLLSACSPVSSSPSTDPIDIPKPTSFQVPGWNLVFQDEFDDPNHTELLWNKLSYGYKDHGRLQYYLPEQVQVSDGTLQLNVDRNEFKTFPYRSGSVTTQKKFEPLYGKFVIRAKLPAGQGIFPAIWLLPANNQAFPEIDIVEMLGQSPQELWHVAHENETTNQHQVSTTYNGAEWNNYSLNWTAEWLIYSINGMETFRTPNISNTPMYLWMNVAVGGAWAGMPDLTTPTETKMEVDYVRIFQKTN